MIIGPVSTVADCDDALAKIQQARRECCGTDRALICCYDDMAVELEAIRAALLPEQREP